METPLTILLRAGVELKLTNCPGGTGRFTEPAIGPPAIGPPAIGPPATGPPRSHCCPLRIHCCSLQRSHDIISSLECSLSNRGSLTCPSLKGGTPVRIKKARWVSGLVGVGALTLLRAFTLVASPAGLTQAQTPGAATAIKVALRRITETQNRHTIAHILGPSIKINSRFEPEKRVDRLLAIGSTQLSLTSSGFEQYFALATSISDQVLAENQRTVLFPCKPVDPTRADEACARLFIETYG